MVFLWFKTSDLGPHEAVRVGGQPWLGGRLGGQCPLAAGGTVRCGASGGGARAGAPGAGGGGTRFHEAGFRGFSIFPGEEKTSVLILAGLVAS